MLAVGLIRRECVMSLRSIQVVVCVILPLVPGSIAVAAPADDASKAWFSFADRCIERSISRGDLPGAVLLVGQDDQVVYRKAYGNKAVEPEKVPMTPDTIFDMASCSKVVGTATSVMILAERGKLKLSDKVTQYLPAFAANGKGEITVEQLLLHCSGMIPDNSLNDYKEPAKAIDKICELKTVYEPGKGFRYSDVNYILLGEIVRIASGKPLDKFARDEIFTPLGMKDTCYNPADGLKPRCAPTEQREGRWMIGEVHDPRAYALGGVAGHAGMFSTVNDMARYCRMILGGGELEGTRILKSETVADMTKCRYLPREMARGYGWDIGTDYSSPRGLFFPKGESFGHTGFTGTSMWIDPVHKVYVILLTNAVHPKEGKSVVELRRQVSTAAAGALIATALEDKAKTVKISNPAVAAVKEPTAQARDGCDSARGAPAEVLCGIDVLERDSFKLLEGRNIAIITNHTGRNRQGLRTIDLLVRAPNIKVLALLSPEHGLYGAVDEKVGDTVDKGSGLKVYSLYGKTNRPTDEMLAGVDTVVYDIQDIGCRYYTYPTTLAYAMEEAAKRKIKVIVLDRPNPITGLSVDGPCADRSRLSFTAYRPIPVTHGMTIGELARMHNGENRIGCNLTVVPLEGWRRDMWWDQTDLMWTNPSPNMRNLTQATLYPITCVIEATNISVGRGTDQPFEFFGAPWIEARKLAAALNGSNLPGLRFIPIEFTPDTSKFKNQLCQGIYVMVTQREAIEPIRSAVTLAWHLYHLFGDKFDAEKVVNLLANAEVAEAIKTAKDPALLSALWQGPLESFKKTREKYLMYR